MAVNECIPYFEPGSRVPASVLTGKTVTGKRFVEVAGDPQSPLEGLNALTDGGNIQIEHCAAKGQALGVSSHDAAAGDKVTVLRGGMVVPVEAGEALGANELVMSNAEGKAVKAAEGEVLGITVGPAESGKDAPIALLI